MRRTPDIIQLGETPHILLTRTDRIGDLVLTTPLFQALRERFPQSRISALVFIEHRELVEGNPFLDEVILYDKKGTEKNLLGQWKMARRLRRKQFDLAVHFHSTNRMHLLSWMAGIGNRLGYDRKLPRALTHVFPYNKKEGEKTETEYLFNLLKPLGVRKPETFDLYLPLLEKYRLSLESLLEHLKVPFEEKWAVINPSASDETKRWPAQKFSLLVAELEKKHKMHWLIIGSKSDGKIAEELARKMHASSFTNLCGKLTLGMLGVLLSKSKILISNDSGPVHISSAVKTPVVSIFGRVRPGLGADRWKPLGEKSRTVVPEACEMGEERFTYIQNIPVERVRDAALELLGSRS